VNSLIILKAADVSAIYKGSEPISIVNYRPISVPSAIPKVFERLLERQIVPFIDTKNIYSAYRKKYSAERALIRVIENIRKIFDSKGVLGKISIDLSKIFDCMPHDVLITKLNVCGFGAQSLRLIANCFSNGKQ